MKDSKKSHSLNLFLPPIIGSILLTGLAMIWEAFEDSNKLEPCEMYTLSSAHYLILFLGSTLVGAVIQFFIIEQIIKIISIQNKYHWLAAGIILTVLIGTGIAFLLGSGMTEIDTFSIGLLLAAVYLAGALTITRKIKLRDLELTIFN